MRVTESLRETGVGEGTRPRNLGEFDGESKVASLRLLLAAHENEVTLPDRRWSRFIQKLGIVLLQGIVWLGPKQTPAELAEVLRNSPALSNRTNPSAPLPPGPRVIVIRSTPAMPTWMTAPAAAPARRLDGTLVDSPIVVYGPTRHRR